MFTLIILRELQLIDYSYTYFSVDVGHKWVMKSHGFSRM